MKQSKPRDGDAGPLPFFAVKLKSLREAVGLTQAQLARKTGLHLGAVFKLEQGKREPTWETVQLLALALGVGCENLRDESVQLPEQVEPAEPPKTRGRPKKTTEPAAEKPAEKEQGKGTKKATRKRSGKGEEHP